MKDIKCAQNDFVDAIEQLQRVAWESNGEIYAVRVDKRMKVLTKIQLEDK
jgi:hypothetical protein